MLSQDANQFVRSHHSFIISMTANSTDCERFSIQFQTSSNNIPFDLNVVKEGGTQHANTNHTFYFKKYLDCYDCRLFIWRSQCNFL